MPTTVRPDPVGTKLVELDFVARLPQSTRRRDGARGEGVRVTSWIGVGEVAESRSLAVAERYCSSVTVTDDTPLPRYGV